MGQVGVCWEAVAENFSHLKTEFHHQERFGSRLAARTAVMDYFEGWYNRRPTAGPAAHHQQPPTPLTKPPFKNRWPPNQQQRELSQKPPDRRPNPRPLP